MTRRRSVRRPIALAAATLSLLFVATISLNAQQVIGYSELSFNKSAGQVDTWSETDMDANTAANYDAYVEGYVFINGTNVNSGYAEGNPSAGGGFTETLTIGDTYEIDSYHYLIQYFGYYDQYGNAYYYNPYYYLADGNGDGYDPNGYAYTDGGGPLYYENYQYLFLGATWVYVDTHPPNITSISPTDGSVESSGTITVSGSYLEDVFTQSTQPAITGSGVTLSVKSVTPTQVSLGYSIAENATPGAQTLTLTTYFGTSNGKTFTVGDPTPVVKTVSPSTWDAGNSYSVTITGTGFGTKPTVSLSGTGVTFSQSTGGDTQITGTVTVANAAPDQTITVTVQNNGYYGYNFQDTYPGQSPDGSNTATVQAIAAPAPKILWNGTDITGKTGNKAVTGQQIKLTTSVTLPSGLAITSNSWSIGGTPVGGYDATNSSGQVVVLTTTQASITLYWVYAGNGLTAQYSYCMNNNQCSTAVQTSFDISGVTGGPMASAPASGSSNVDKLTGCTGDTGGPWMVYGNETGISPNCTQNPTGTPGINFDSSKYTAPGGGNFLFAQLINNQQIVWTPTSGSKITCNSNPGLDKQYPAAKGTKTSDSPSMILYNKQTGVQDLSGSRTFNASMYAMWQSSTSNSIPVPLGYQVWGFSASVTQDGKGNWPKPTGSGGPQGAFVTSKSSQPFNGYPTWSGLSKCQ